MASEQNTPDTYQAPAVTVLGSVAELTLHNSTGAHFDASFTAGEPAQPPFS